MYMDMVINIVKNALNIPSYLIQCFLYYFQYYSLITFL